MLVYCQLDPWEQTSGKFQSKYKTFSLTKCIWKYRLRNGAILSRGDELTMELHMFCTRSSTQSSRTPIKTQRYLVSQLFIIFLRCDSNMMDFHRSRDQIFWSDNKIIPIIYLFSNSACVSKHLQVYENYGLLGGNIRRYVRIVDAML